MVCIFKFSFSFVFFCTCFRFEMFISVLGFVFLFSGSVFLFWVCCILFLHWRHRKKRETVFALCFRLLFVASGTINYRARSGFHFYAWCRAKNSFRKDIRSFHNTENSYRTTLKRTMHNINNIITWNFRGTVKPSVSGYSKGWDLEATYRRLSLTTASLE